MTLNIPRARPLAAAVPLLLSALFIAAAPSASAQSAVATKAATPKPVSEVAASHLTRSSVVLSWHNPSSKGFEGVMIRKAAGKTPPSSPTAGSVAGTVVKNHDSKTITGLAASHTYSFALFARGRHHRYSKRVTKTITTRHAPVKPVTPPTTLSAGQTLDSGQMLLSTSGVYRAIMQTDGNFVLYKRGVATAIWSTVTGGHPGATITMQTDGNLVVYPKGGGTALWSSTTGLSTGDHLSMQDDGNLVIYSEGTFPLWDYGSGVINHADTLTTGETLDVGQALWSADGAYEAIMQADGNFVLYKAGVTTAIWSTVTGGHPGATITMQADGNLVVYPPGGGTALWSSGSAPSGGDHLSMQEDGNLVIYNSSNVARWDWQSGVLSGGGTGGVIGDDYPANLKNAAQDSLFDPWRFYNRECTSFVAWRLNSVNGVAFNDYYRGPRWGDASNWGPTARSLGITVNSTPTRGAVAWESGGDHVAWVADVRADGSIDIEEYNEHLDGTYDTRHVAASAFEYIHI